MYLSTVSIIIIAICGFAIYFIYDKIEFIGFTLIFIFTIVYFSFPIVFEISEIMFNIFSQYHSIQYSDVLALTISIFGLAISTILSFLFKIKSKEKKYIDQAEKNKKLYDLMIIDFDEYDKRRQELKEKFNQKAYTQEWDKKNMKLAGARFKKEFVDEFKEACSKLGIKQSDVFRKAMQNIIDQAKNG